MRKSLLLFFSLCLGLTTVHAQSIRLPKECQKIIKTEFRSWKIADVPETIKDYYKRERAYEQPNLIKGDWNGDGKTDYALLLDNKQNSEKRRIILVLMKQKNNYKSFILGGDDCIMSVKKGKKDYDFNTGKTFRYKKDAIFTYIWEKAGVSYVWEKGKFGIITTSD